MRSVISIATNELRRLFISPFAWIIVATVQFLLAIFFYLLLSKFMEAGTSYAGPGLTEFVVVGLLQTAGITLLFISPFITMRTFSDEFRSGTIKLLLSSPVSITELVLGKYLGTLAFYLILLIVISLMPLSLMLGARLDPGLLVSGLLGLSLLISALAAIGLFVSSLTNSPAFAAVGTFFLTFILWIFHVASDSDSELIETIANYLSLQKHFNYLLSGAFSTVDVSYFLLIIALFIVLCVWRLDAIRTHQ